MNHCTTCPLPLHFSTNQRVNSPPTASNNPAFSSSVGVQLDRTWRGLAHVILPSTCQKQPLSPALIKGQYRSPPTSSLADTPPPHRRETLLRVGSSTPSDYKLTSIRRKSGQNRAKTSVQETTDTRKPLLPKRKQWLTYRRTHVLCNIIV